MTEEMKAIQALAASIGKELKCSGDGVPDNTTVDDKCFSRDKRGVYTYTVRDKP